jgi:hypothetical protein
VKLVKNLIKMKKVPVKKDGIEIGYTLDDGKTIQFYDTPSAKKVIEELNSGETIGISSCGISEVIENRVVRPIEITELAFLQDDCFKLNESIESNRGTWELFKECGSNVHQLQYWLSDGDRPQVVLNLTPEEFEDLETLFVNVKKYRNEE